MIFKRSSVGKELYCAIAIMQSLWLVLKTRQMNTFFVKNYLDWIAD
jgi:hypothetical protein